MCVCTHTCACARLYLYMRVYTQRRTGMFSFTCTYAYLRSNLFYFEGDEFVLKPFLFFLHKVNFSNNYFSIEKIYSLVLQEGFFYDKIDIDPVYSLMSCSHGQILIESGFCLLNTIYELIQTLELRCKSRLCIWKTLYYIIKYFKLSINTKYIKSLTSQ